MRSVTNFPDYSQKENLVTNNCLLALKSFYEAGPDRLGNILAEIFPDFSDSVSLGVRFAQQEALTGRGITDGFIGQAPFKVYIETKRGTRLDDNQIKRYVKEIKTDNKGDTKLFLLGLVGGMAKGDEEYIHKLKDFAEESDITFEKIAFIDLLGVMEEEIKGYKAYDPRLGGIIEDFEDFLAGKKLLPSNVLVSLNAPNTLNLNVKHGLYYDGTRPDGKDYPDLEEAKFMGLYKNKLIQHVGVIGKRNIKYDSNGNGNEWQKRIHHFIESIDDPEYREQVKSFKFHLVNELPVSDQGKNADGNENKYFYSTNLKKISSGGQWGRRRFFRWEWITDCKNAKELADKLNGLEYESNLRLVDPHSPEES